MATHTVKQDGSGDYTNITDALAACNASDTVEIQDSETYSEGNLSRIRASLTIKAGAGHSPVLDGGGTLACAIKFYNFWRIEGLTITNYTGAGLNGAGLVSISGNRVATIYNCTLYNLADTAIVDLKTGSLVSNCTIYNIHTLQLSARGIDAGVQGVTVEQCLIYDVINSGINTTSASSLIEQCTVYNTGYGGNTSYAILASLGTAKWNVVVDPQHNLGGAGLRAGSHSYNCVSGSENASDGNFYDGAGTGDTESDPFLITGSLRPGAGSAATGGAVGSTTLKDILSGSRTWNYDQKVIGVNTGATPYDMGAIEATYTTVNGTDTQYISKVLGVS